jgi:hypothetical protein
MPFRIRNSWTESFQIQGLPWRGRFESPRACQDFDWVFDNRPFVVVAIHLPPFRGTAYIATTTTTEKTDGEEIQMRKLKMIVIVIIKSLHTPYPRWNGFYVLYSWPVNHLLSPVMTRLCSASTSSTRNNPRGHFLCRAYFLAFVQKIDLREYVSPFYFYNCYIWRGTIQVLGVGWVRTVQYCTVLYSTVLYCTVPGTVLYVLTVRIIFKHHSSLSVVLLILGIPASMSNPPIYLNSTVSEENTTLHVIER